MANKRENLIWKVLQQSETFWFQERPDSQTNQTWLQAWKYHCPEAIYSYVLQPQHKIRRLNNKKKAMIKSQEVAWVCESSLSWNGF